MKRQQHQLAALRCTIAQSAGAEVSIEDFLPPDPEREAEKEAAAQRAIFGFLKTTTTARPPA